MIDVSCFYLNGLKLIFWIININNWLKKFLLSIILFSELTSEVAVFSQFLYDKINVKVYTLKLKKI